MIEIIPAILPKDYEELKNKAALVRGIVPIVQVDLCDGTFVPNKTWPFSTGGEHDFHFQMIINEEEGMPLWADVDYELDLMVSDAVENFDLYAKLGAKRMIFHIEAVGDLEKFKEFLEGMDVYLRDNIQIGLAINTTTPIEKIFPLVNEVDYIQCMGIEHIGFQGEDFDERVLEQIKTLKEKYPDLMISVDGGVNFEILPRIIEAGAERAVVGSAIFKSDKIREAINELEYMV